LDVFTEALAGQKQLKTESSFENVLNIAHFLQKSMIYTRQPAFRATFGGPGRKEG
jgi:hypothetical protein